MNSSLPLVARTPHTNHRPVGVIDIGSHSIRLVIYRRYGRYPLPLFNERVPVKLGEGLDKSETLSPEKIELGLSALRRFSLIIQGISLGRTFVIATAAVRRAKNAPDFIKPAEDILGAPVTVLSAQEEARLATRGLTANLQNISGLIADLGGGSLELVLVRDGNVQESTSLNMGHLSSRTKTEIVALLKSVDWLEKLSGASLYGIGGSFRALGSAYVKRTSYPLFLLHGLELKSGTVMDILSTLKGDKPDVQGVPVGRRASIGMAAEIIFSLIECSQVGQITISGTSIRDGIVADMDNSTKPKKDPLLSACKEIAGQSQRFEGLNEMLMDCLAPATSLFEMPDSRRLFKAACLLSDISWNEPPELRGAVAADRILALPIFSLSHKERTWLAKAVYHRYEGTKENKPSFPVFTRLLSPSEGDEALALGLGLRFALIYCAGIPDYLSAVTLVIAGQKMRFQIAPNGMSLFDEHSLRRLKVFAKACGTELEEVGRDETPLLRVEATDQS